MKSNSRQKLFAEFILEIKFYFEKFQERMRQKESILLKLMNIKTFNLSYD